MSASAPKGQMTAVVGPTEVQETSLLWTINRFYDVDAGGIYFDGKDIRGYDLDSLRRARWELYCNSVLFLAELRDYISDLVCDAIIRKWLR